MQTCRSMSKTNFCALKTFKVAISYGSQSIFNKNAISMKMQQLQRSETLAFELIKATRRKLFVNTKRRQMFGFKPVDAFFCMRNAILFLQMTIKQDVFRDFRFSSLRTFCNIWSHHTGLIICLDQLCPTEMLCWAKIRHYLDDGRTFNDLLSFEQIKV